MHLRHLADAPVQERGALRSWILMDAATSALATWS
jgi:hypothetical protein